MSKANPKPDTKEKLHPRSIHKNQYNFEKLIEIHPALKVHVIVNKYGTQTINFSKAESVKCLNEALLKEHYQIMDWDIPKGYLCPPIPGRADYLHYVADLLAENNNNAIPKGKSIRAFDIGTGANCIYPLLGTSLYGWRFTATDIDEVALDAAKQNLEKNPKINGLVNLKLQLNSKDIFYGTLKRDDFYEVSICNPPFHASAKEAFEANNRKVKNVLKNKPEGKTLNFGGMPAELWCDGGEKRFILNMMRQSAKFKANILWFTTLVSKEHNLGQLQAGLDQYKPQITKVIEMGQGNKKSRILAWTFFDENMRNTWMKQRVKKQD